MKVKMLTQTRFEGKVLMLGDEIEVNDKIASRWGRAHIAAILPNDVHDAPVAVAAGTAAADEHHEKALADMTAKELYKLCIEKGLEVAEKQPKDVYIELLTVPVTE